MKSLIRLFVARGVSKKGLRGGSSIWLVIGALQFLGRMYTKHAKKTETVTLGERLRPGDELTLRYPGKPARKTRKEVAADLKRRQALDAAYQRQIAELTSAQERGGRRAKKATKALRELLENPPK